MSNLTAWENFLGYNRWSVSLKIFNALLSLQSHFTIFRLLQVFSEKCEMVRGQMLCQSIVWQQDFCISWFTSVPFPFEFLLTAFGRKTSGAVIGQLNTDKLIVIHTDRRNCLHSLLHSKQTSIILKRWPFWRIIVKFSWLGMSFVCK